MRYYIIVGEASGDLHASNLIKELRRQDEKAEIRAWGGDLMTAAGADLVRHYKDTAIMGVVRVIKNLSTIKANIKYCTEDITSWNPDVVILVDYAGFNLRIAKFTKSVGIKTYYYISPKIWAWGTGRIKQIKAYVDKMFTIFPFETEFYAKYGYKVNYEGNPLVDAVAEHYDNNKTKSIDEFCAKYGLNKKPIIAILAGSRSQELRHVLPIMLEMIAFYPDYQFVIAGAPSMSDDDYAPYVRGYNVKIIYDATYSLLRHSWAAVVTSGTATLETALFKVPQVVCYKGEGGRFTYFLFKYVVKVDYMSLVNLIFGTELVKELLMQKLNVKRLKEELALILPKDSSTRKTILDGYEQVSQRLGGVGASSRVAQMIINELTK